MKKRLPPTLITLALGACLYAQVGPPPHVYQGPPDDMYWTGTENYDVFTRTTTLGLLARYSDVIGMGQVSNRTDDHLTVTVDYALVGCTNGQSIVMYETPPIQWAGGGGNGIKSDYMPTNNSRIVFAAFTNDYSGGRRMFWNSPEIPYPPPNIQTNYELRYLNRSWWYPERDDGVLFTQFTNVLQAVRFDRNWTNFFYLCRDGAFSASNRVKEDSYWDIRVLAASATDERAQFMLDDPLVDPVHTDGIFTGGWRAKFPDE